jgi:hypothetical protein
MFDVQMLNSDASLNAWYPIVSLSYVPGSNLTMVIQLLLDREPQVIRYIPPSAAVVTLTFTNEDQTTLVKTGALIDAGDRSILSISLSPAETQAIGSNNVVVSIDVNGDQSVIYMSLLENALIRTSVTGSCC